MRPGEHRARTAATQLALCGAVLWVLAATGTARALEAQASVGAATDYVVHGLTRSRGDPAAQAELSLALPTGTVLGAWASTVDLSPGADAEYAVFASQRFRAGMDFAFDASAARYLYPGGSRSIDYDYTELRAALAYRDTVELSLAYSPDWSMFSRYGLAEDERALWTDLSVGYPVSPRLRLTGGVGYADLSDAVDDGYTYYSAGVEWRWRQLVLGLVYVGTVDAEHLFTGTAADGLVGSLIWVIH